MSFIPCIQGLTKAELEEYIINILTNLVCHSTGSQKARILTKFIENNCEKVERLVELHTKYLSKLSKTDTELDKKREVKSLTSRNLEVIFVYGIFRINPCGEE